MHLSIGHGIVHTVHSLRLTMFFVIHPIDRPRDCSVFDFDLKQIKTFYGGVRRKVRLK